MKKLIAILFIGAALGALATPAQAGTKWAARPKPFASAPAPKWGPWMLCDTAYRGDYHARSHVTPTPDGKWAVDAVEVKRASATRRPPEYDIVDQDFFDRSTFRVGYSYGVTLRTGGMVAWVHPNPRRAAQYPASSVTLYNGSIKLCETMTVAIS